MCITAAEDVGFGDPDLMNLVIACSTLYRAGAGPDVLRKIWLFLTEQMCMTQKSRIFCQLSLIENAIERGEVASDLSAWERAVIKQLKTGRVLPHGSECTPKTNWALKNNWRADGMLKFQATIDMPFELQSRQVDVAYQLLSGLSYFTYDTHTRLGRAVCAELAGHNVIRDLLKDHPPSGGKTAAVGWGLFFAEGSRIADGLEDVRLNLLEAKAIAGQLGWTAEVWNALVNLVNEALSRGIVNEIRRAVLMSVAHRGIREPECLNLFE